MQNIDFHPNDILWIKQIGTSERWAYMDVPELHPFNLHWPNTAVANVKKPDIGQIIILKQHHKLTHLVVPYSNYIGESELPWPYYREVICLKKFSENNAPDIYNVFPFSLAGGAHGIGYSLDSFLKTHQNIVDKEILQQKIWNAFFPNRNSFTIEWPQKNKYNISEIRIIPMSGLKEFENQTIEEIQDGFFINDLLNRKGCEYKYRDQGLNSVNNALLLFQMYGQIIACARLNKVIKYNKPALGIYHGAYSLYPDSIQVFKPITYDEIKAVCPDTIPFGLVKQNLSLKYLDDIIKLIVQKSKDYMLTGTGVLKATEVAEEEAKSISNAELLKRINNNKTPKPRSKSATVVHYRDPYLKELVRRIAGGKCQLCHEDAPFLDKLGNPYLEEHHVKQLADGGKDCIDNVVALCPNCHTKLHIVKDEKDVNKLKYTAISNQEKSQQI